MKKMIIALALVMGLTSCSSTGQGALGGTWIGGAIGSAIGGIAGGPRGSDIGTLIGMAGGAATGAAIGAAAEKKQYSNYTATRAVSAYDSSDDYNYTTQTAVQTERSELPVYDDVITMESAPQVQQTTVGQQQSAYTPIVISNVSFINGDNTQHIARGELVKISFEVRNVTDGTLTQIVPIVKETTGNKRLFISPSTLIESLDAKKAIRYTAYVSAQANLKTGTAHFSIQVNVQGQKLSNTVEFDVPLN